MKSPAKRLDALDGLRGMAILMVFLNHFDSVYIINFFPSFFRPVIGTVFSSGTIGVSLLFILSGLLMAYIYHQPISSQYFWQKRYTRIFPLFITMALVMTVFRVIPGLSPPVRILTILGLALAGNFIWTGIIQRINRPVIGKAIFIGFKILQIITGILYLLIMKRPPVFFNQMVPKFFHEVMITLVNATLTLPLGNYIPMLDGVYWSLASEILFYIIYPIICLPLIMALSKQKLRIKILFLFSLLPFFSALDQLSLHLFNLRMLFFPFFMYFATGISVGWLLRNRGKFFERNFSLPGQVASPAGFIIIIILTNLSLSHTTGQLNTWLRMFWSFPLTLSVVFILNRETAVSRFFRSRWLIFLGTVSYSIYLSHTAIVDSVHLIFRPTGVLSNLVFIFIVSLIVLLVAPIIHYLLEKPYFSTKVKTERPKNYFFMPVPALAFGLAAILFVSVFFAYQSHFNFFSFEKGFGKEAVVSPRISGNTKRISIINYPEIDFRIRSTEDNLGIVTADLSYDELPLNDKKPTVPQQLVFQIKPVTATEWYATNTYLPNEIGESRFHPFGFPVIENSGNKEYDIRLYLTNPKASQNIFLNINGTSLTTVHQLNKKDLIKNPVKLAALLFNRIGNVIKNKEAGLTALQLLPFLCLISLLSAGFLFAKKIQTQ